MANDDVIAPCAKDVREEPIVEKEESKYLLETPGPNQKHTKMSQCRVKIE